MWYIVNKYDNNNHSTVKLKPVDVKSSTYVDFEIRNNIEYPNFQDGDHVTILEYCSMDLCNRRF